MNSDISGDFPNAGKIYLNNASVSLMPSVSIEAVKDFLVSYNSVGPDSKDSASFVAEKLQNVRSAISKMIKCQPDEVVLTQSTSDGVNIVANGISWGPDSNVVIRGMSHEHHSNLYPWLKLRERVSVKSLDIDENGFFDPGQLESAVDKNTGLVALSHALYNTGSILPVGEAGAALHGRTPFFIDAAQSVGCIGEMDVSEIRCDFMSFNGSKWLCGPMGTGVFYCGRESSGLLEPAAIGGESAMIYDDTKLAYKDLPDKFQTGFRNYAGMVGLESSIRYLSDFGLDRIRERNRHLSGMLRDGLSRLPNVTLYGPDDPDLRTSIVSFNIRGIEPAEVVDRLERRNIILAVRELVHKKIVRASPHFFNTESEMLAVLDAIKGL